MALATYTDLVTSIGNWLNRTDLASVIPDFVTLAESRMARDLRLRKMVTTATLTTVAGTQSVTVPDDLLEIENLTLTNTSPQRTISVVTPEIMDIKFPAGFWTGIPQVYCVIGTDLQLGPTPDAAYQLQVAYYQRQTPLSGSSTNWILTYHPSIYLSAALHEAYAYLKDEERSLAWLTKYEAEKKALEEYDDTTLRSGSSMRVRAI